MSAIVAGISLFVGFIFGFWLGLKIGAHEERRDALAWLESQATEPVQAENLWRES